MIQRRSPMKKQTLLAASLILVLAACSPAGGDSSSLSIPSSSDSSSSSISSSSSRSATDIFIESGWPEEEAKTLASLFLDHLYPYYDFGKLGYTYELTTYQESYNMVSAHLEIAGFPFSELRNYLSAMTDGTGYLDKTDDYEVPEGQYIIERLFDDYSLVSASFSLKDENDEIITEGIGTFELDIHPGRIAKEAWLGGEIEDDVSDLLESPISLPAPTSPASRYITAVYLRYGKPVPSLFFVGVNAMDGYGSDLAAAGWKKVPLNETGYEDRYYYISPDETIGITIYIANPSEPLVTVLEFEKAQFFINYPEGVVNDLLETLFLSTQHISLPIPEAEGTTYYFVNDVLAADNFFEIYVHGVDYADAYETKLKEAGYHLVDYDVYGEQFYYADSSETMYVYTYSKSEIDATVIRAGRNSFYYAGWPEKIIDRMTETLGGETMLPVDGGATYTNVGNFPSGSEDFAVFTKNLDENLNLIDTTQRYEALLNTSNSGWTYDEVEDCWHDAKGKLKVTVRFYEQEGVRIYVQYYIPSSKALSESELSAAFSSIGVEDYSFETVDGARGYSLIAEGENSFTIIAWGVDESILASYEEKLASKSYSSKKAGGITYHFDGSKKVSFTMNHDEEEETLTIALQSYGSRFNYSASSFLSYVAKVHDEYDSAFTFPSIPCQDGSEGIIRLYETFGDLTFSIAIFERGFMDELKAALVKDGWTKSEDSDAHYLRTGNNYLWDIYLYEDVENNYTDIDITGKA